MDVLATVVVTPRERFSTALRCLPNVIEHTKAPHRLVYVAGGAPAYLRETLKQSCKAPAQELVLEPDYLSPNQARNIGLRHVQTKYAVFLDNDVVVEPGWLEALVRCAEETGADVVGPLCLFGEPDKGIIHSAGGDLTFGAEGEYCRMDEKHRLANVCLKTQSVELKRAPCDYVEFHCMLTRRDLFDRIGFLDEEILSSGEHMDVALLVRKLGGKIYTETAAVVSYLTDAEYLISDAEFFRLRWCDDWNQRSLAHFAAKWNLDPHSLFFKDYRSFLRRQQEICPLPRPVSQTLGDVHALRHPFAQTILQLLNQMSALGYPAWDLEMANQAYATAVGPSAGIVRESGKPLLAHLVGTASVLAGFGAPATVVVAGLLHTAYTYGRYPGHAELDLEAQRRWITSNVGWRAEALVYELSSMDYPEAQTNVMESECDRLRLNLAYSILIRIANSIDEHMDNGLLFNRNSEGSLSTNKAQNERWEPLYRKVAARLGCEPMVDLLLQMQEDLRKAPAWSIPRFGLEGSYEIDVKTGAPAALKPRQVTGRSRSKGRAGVPTAYASNAPLLERLSSRNLGPPIHKVALKTIRPQHKGTVRPAATFLQRLIAPASFLIETDPRQWCFSADVNIKPVPEACGPAVLLVRLAIKSGAMGVGLLRSASTTEYAVPEQGQEAGAKPVDLLFPIPDLREAGRLVFRNWDPSGTVTIAQVFSISLHNPDIGPQCSAED